jgi:hypothetical protein
MTRTYFWICALCLLAGAGLLAGCIGTDEEEATAPLPEFRGEMDGYDDRVIFRFIPDTTSPGTYVARYEITRDGTTHQSRSNEGFDGISSENPIRFTVPREPEESVAISLEIRNEDGILVHESWTAVGSVFSAR